MNNSIIVFVRGILYVLLMIGLSEIIRLDISLGYFGENAYTEWFQQGVLLIICLLTFILQFSLSHKLLLRSIAVLSTAMLIREFNNFFLDHFFKNAWQILVLLIVIPSLIHFFKNRRVLWQEIKNVQSHYSVGVLTSGAIILFLFSRLYGRKTLWMTLMAEKYERKLKDVAEESIESLGYAIILIGILELLFYVKKNNVLNPDYMH